MEFERTKHGEVLPPADWSEVTMDASDVEDDDYILEIIAIIHDAGLLVEFIGDVLTVTKRLEPRDGADKFAVQSFNIGIAPSLENEGFKNIKFL